MQTPLHVDQPSAAGYEPAMSSENGSSAASMMGDFMVHEAISRTASGRAQPGHIIMINLIESFNKVVGLPDIDVWRRLSKPIVCAMDRLQLQIRTSSVFIKRTTPWTPTYCVLCGKGHLVIYAKEEQRLGYAVNLAAAKRLDISCGHNDDENPENSYCTITAKWKFGTLVVQLAAEQLDVWRKAFLDAFDGRGGSSGTTLANQQAVVATAGGSGAHRLANRAYRVGQAAAVIAEEESSNRSEMADVFSVVDTDATNDTKGEPLDFDASEEEQQPKRLDTSDHIAECTTPPTVVETTPKAAAAGGELADSAEDELLNSKMWSDDEPPIDGKAMRRSYYASLPMSFAHRYRSDGALRLVPRGDRRSERQPLMEWLSQVGADDRFRRARTYFETGRFPQSPIVESRPPPRVDDVDEPSVSGTSRH